MSNFATCMIGENAMIRAHLSLLVILCALVSSCHRTYIGGECEITEDCHSEWNNIPDTVCVDGLCKCIDPAKDHCCFRDRIENCSKEDPYQCRPKEQCDPMAPFIFPDAGADASDGG